MYYITGIYCKTLDSYLKMLYIGRGLVFAKSGDTLRLPSYAYDKVLIRIYDSSDKSVEWLELRDFFYIVETNKLDIGGLDSIEFYSDSIKTGNASLTNPDSVKRISIINKYNGMDDSNINAYARQKMSGATFDRWGSLERVPRSFVNGGILYLPDNVLSVAFRVNCNDVRGSGAGALSVSGDYDFRRTCKDLKYLMSCCCIRKLIIRGDFSLTPALFQHLLCDIEVEGVLSCKDIVKLNNIDYLSSVCKNRGKTVFYFSDSKNLFKYDIIKNELKIKSRIV